VLQLGDEVTVRVDDIDNAGKLSLSLVGGDDEGGDGASGGDEHAPARSGDTGGNGRREGSARDVASFDESWDAQARDTFGDLGPAEATRDRGDRGERGGERRGGGRGRRPRR